jgi:uncharacterized protein YjdB
MPSNPTRVCVPALLFATLAIASCEAGTFVTSVEPHAAGEPATLEITDFPEAIHDGDTVRISARVLDANGLVLQGVRVVWSSAAPWVAAVTAAGQLTGESPGEAVLTASAGDLSTSRKPTVRPTPVRLVLVTGTEQAAGPGEVLQDSLVAQVLDRHGKPVPGVFVDFVVASGGGTASPLAMETDAAGVGRTQWTLGTADAPQRLEGRARRPALSPNLKDSVVVFTARVTTAPPTAATIEIAPAAPEMVVGDTLRLTATVRDSHGNVLSGHSVNWGSSTASSTAVATVDSTGLVTARGEGSATILATSEGVTGSSAITVQPPANPIPVLNTISPTSAVAGAGALELMTSGTDFVPTSVVRWNGSDRSTTFVSSTELRAAIPASDLASSGEAGVSVFSPGPGGGESRGVNFLIDNPPPPPPASVASIEITPDSASLHVGDTLRLTATARDSNGTVVTGHTLTWASSAPIVVKVDHQGHLTAHGAGSATVSAATDGVVGSATIVVEESSSPGAITVSSPTDTMTVGQAVTLWAVARDANGVVIPDPGIQWMSRRPEIASVDAQGVVIGRALGTAIIIASAACCTADSAFIRVEPGVPGAVADLQVTGTTSGSVTLRWTQVDDGAGAPASYQVRYGSPSISWGPAYQTQVEVPGTAIGQPLGYTFEGLAAGTSYEFQLVSYRGVPNVNAVFGKLSNVAGASTDSPAGGSIVISPASQTLSVGQSVTLLATATDDSGNTIPNPGVQWSSLNPEIATVDSMGTVLARAVGIAYIVASAPCCSGEPARITSVNSSPAIGVWRGNEPEGMTTFLDDRHADMSAWRTAWVNGDREIVAGVDVPTPVSPNAMRIKYPEGHPDGSGPGMPYTETFGVTAQEIYIATVSRASENWVEHNLGIKQLGPTVANANGNYVYLNRYTGGSNNHFSITPNWMGGPVFTANVNLAAAEIAGPGVWQQIEIYIRWQDSGQSNGIVRFWVDGVLAGEHTGVEFGVAGGGFSSYAKRGVWGGGGWAVPDDQWLYYGHTYIAYRRSM